MSGWGVFAEKGARGSFWGGVGRKPDENHGHYRSRESCDRVFCASYWREGEILENGERDRDVWAADS